MTQNLKFISPRLGVLDIENLMQEISNFVEDEPESSYRLVIGTDSQVKKSNGVAECDFVTAIIIHRIGYGARYFWRKEKVTTAPVLRDKIYKETMMSLELANELVPDLKGHMNGSNYALEIHIDVGSVGPTREMIREVVGMVTGSGYVAKTKPESWGASKVADRYT